MINGHNNNLSPCLLLQAVLNEDLGLVEQAIQEYACQFTDKNLANMNSFHYATHNSAEFIFDLFELYDNSLQENKYDALIQLNSAGKSPLYTAICCDNAALFGKLWERNARQLSSDDSENKEYENWRSLFTVLIKKNATSIVRSFKEEFDDKNALCSAVLYNESALSKIAHTFEEIVLVRSLIVNSRIHLYYNANLDENERNNILEFSRKNPTPLMLSEKLKWVKCEKELLQPFIELLDQGDELADLVDLAYKFTM